MSAILDFFTSIIDIVTGVIQSIISLIQMMVTGLGIAMQLISYIPIQYRAVIIAIVSYSALVAMTHGGSE